MGTRSRIGVMHGNVCKSVYCHWDGYPEYNGAILNKFYNDSVKANKLVSMGDISSLGTLIGEKHEFGIRNEYVEVDGNEFAKECTFYGRDREEQNTEFKATTTFEKFLEEVKSCGAEYYYIMAHDQWYMGSVYDTRCKDILVPLKDVLTKVEKQSDES